MKFENYLSLKKALYIAMPCLALSFFVSCSNEEAMGASDELPSGTNLTLTATVPVAKQSYSTRIGIDDDKISNDANVEEPYVWIEGETLTLYWKNLHDSGNDKVIEYKVEGVSNEGKSCLMNPVGSPSLNNGFYKIHALSPHTAFNFVGNELKATIDLGNQNQPDAAVDHAYLSDKMYQYATTVVQIHGGNIVSGTARLPFEFITSLFRVRVVNNTGLPINVNKVKLSYSSTNNTQFYSKGIFTAADPVGVHSYAATADAITNDLSITTNKSLAANDNFDAYMSFFPTEGYNASSSEILNVEIEYDVKDTPGTCIRTPSVNNSIFLTGSKYLSFEGGDRYFLTVTVQSSDLPDGTNYSSADNTLPDASNVDGDGFYPFSYYNGLDAMIHTKAQIVTLSSGIYYFMTTSARMETQDMQKYILNDITYYYYNPSSNQSACPAGWMLPTYQDVYNNDAVRTILRSMPELQYSYAYGEQQYFRMYTAFTWGTGVVQYGDMVNIHHYTHNSQDNERSWQTSHRGVVCVRPI